MVWIIVIVLTVSLIMLIVGSHLKRKRSMKGIIHSLEKHYPEDLTEIVYWEENIRLELAEAQVSLDKGEISDEEFLRKAESLLERHRGIEQKNSVTGPEMFDYYQNYLSSPYYE